MLVAENRKNEFTYNIQAIKNILFSGDTSSIHALEKLLMIQFSLMFLNKRHLVDSTFRKKQRISLIKMEHFFTVYLMLVIKVRFYLKI